MKIAIYSSVVIISLIIGGLVGGALLHWLITNWLLQFGIVKEISFWLCVVTSAYITGLFQSAKSSK